MKTILTACCAVLAAGITMGAQSPAPQPAQPQQPTQAPQTPSRPERPQPDKSRMGEMARAGAMTVTGCLKTWDGSMKDSSGTADSDPATSSKSASKSVSKSAGSATPRYVLTNVTHDGMQKANPQSSASREQTLALMAEDGKVNFQQHLNHKVQLTGNLDSKDQSGQGGPQKSSTGTSGSTGTATAGRSAQDMPMTVPTFNVSSLKMVSASCP